jgi:hypothetical protein
MENVQLAVRVLMKAVNTIQTSNQTAVLILDAP